ncbi:MAG: IclR family transcriptional regulator [bacterium]
MTLNYTVPALDRAIRVLELLANAPQGMSLAQLASQTKVPKSTMFRILYTLHQNSIIIEDSERKMFTLGMKLLEWGNAALSKIDLKTIAHPHLLNLAHETRESFYLAILDHNEVILIDHVDTPEVWKMVTRLGHRSPFHCTATGLVMVSEYTEEELAGLADQQGLKRYTSKTVTSMQKLKKRLEEVRLQGYAVADAEFKADLCAVAVPIRDHSGKISASLMTALPSDRVNRNKEIIPDLVVVLKRDAVLISKRIGYAGEL